MTTTKNFRPGDEITWTHYDATTGEAVERSGQVWSLAPTLAGYARVVWVVPADFRPGFDIYYAVAVGIASRSVRAHETGSKWDTPSDTTYVEKGEVFSSTSIASRLGRMMYAASAPTSPRVLAQRAAA